MNVRKKITGKPKRFPKATQDLADKDNNGRVVIYERTGIRKKYLSEIPVTQAVDMAGNIESVLSESFGGGIYELNLVSGDSEVKGKYSYDIAGNPKGRRQTSSDDQQTRSTNKSSDSQALVTVLGKLADAAIGQRSSSAEEWERTLALAKELKGEDGDYRQMMSQMLSGVVQNALTQQPMDIDNALQIIQLSRELGPTLHQDDSMSSLISLVAPFLYQAFGAKGTGGQPQLTPEQMQMLQPYLQQLQAGKALLPPGQTAQTQGAGDLAASPPEPSPRQQDRAVVHEPGASPNEPEPDEEPDPGHQAFYDMTIVPFRAAVAAGATAEQLGNIVLAMVGTAKQWQGQNPHPLVRGLVAASTPVELDAAFAMFCAAIPELRQNAALQQQIRDYLATVLKEAYDEQQAAREMQEKVRSRFAEADQADQEGEEDLYAQDIGQAEPERDEAAQAGAAVDS